MKWIIVIGLVGMMVLSCVVSYQNAILEERVDELTVQLRWSDQNLDYYQRTYITHTGESASFGPYRIVSLDSGRHWYNFEVDAETQGIYITEAANPLLIDELAAIESLTSHTSKEGLIDLSNLSSVETELLESMGFTVVTVTPVPAAK